MAFAVSFLSREAIPATTVYEVWNYQVTGAPSDLQVDQRIALGFPHDVDVRDPTQYPGVSQLAGTFVERNPALPRQYVGRTVTAAGSVKISFVAPAVESTCEVVLAKSPSGQGWVSQPFTIPNASPSHLQVLPAPRKGLLNTNGRPLTDFRGTLPYASEVIGVYQPLKGWLGALNTLRAAEHGQEGTSLSLETFRKADARTLDDDALAAVSKRFAAIQGVLSPVGMVNLFRQYFFEFDTFLGPPSGHLWLSPGGTVELVETSTRRTLVEKTSEQSEETSRKIEESLTEQEDVADAVKEENANETKLGLSVTGGVTAPIYHAEASANFSTQNTVKSSSETTHKRARTQSAKVTSEIKRNFKSTFKTVTETTDTSSRRYIVQNTTDFLVNYELRRKMRKVGVQMQHIGSRLCWQVYLPDPGRELGLGDLVDVIQTPDLTSIQKPAPPPPLETKTTEFTGPFPILKYPGTLDPPDEENADFVFLFFPPPTPQDPHPRPDLLSYDRAHHIIADAPFAAPPPEPGYELEHAAVKSAKSGNKDCKFVAERCELTDALKGEFRVVALNLNAGDFNTIQVTFSLTWKPPASNPAQEQYQSDLAAYRDKLGQAQREAYSKAVKERLKLVSAMRPRPPEDLRSEERHTVYGELLQKITPLFQDQHVNAEMIRQTFDVEEMLYFVAPDYWRPTKADNHRDADDEHPNKNTVGRYPVPGPPWVPDDDGSCRPNHLAGDTVASWYSQTDKTYTPSPPPPPQPPSGEPPPPVPCPDLDPEWRVNYLITEETQPAPMGSSLGWLIQIDGDQRRNAFLNAAWAKAVLPIRPGQELQALDWLASTVEGKAALELYYPFDAAVDPPEYQGLTVGAVLKLIAEALQISNNTMANTLASEKVFENGFDPLAGGFRPADPYQIFDQWIEVLPTDQVVAVSVTYDPRTGQQL